jgi:hypothetical protein
MKTNNSIIINGKLMGVISAEFTNDKDEVIKYYRCIISQEKTDEFGRPDYNDIQIAVPARRYEETVNACNVFLKKPVSFSVDIEYSNKKMRFCLPEKLDILNQVQAPKAVKSSTG